MYDGQFTSDVQDMLYPELWEGCVGAWFPGWGPTGSTLYDWSGYNQHATLTNMDVATDWVSSAGQWAIDFDGVNDVASATPSAAAVASFPISWGCWINPASVAAYKMPFGCLNGESRQFAFYLAGSSSLYSDNFTGGSLTLSKSISVGVWQHVFVTMNSSTGNVYINGSLAYSGSSFALSAVAGATIRIGASASYPYSGMIDDARIYKRALTADEVRILALSRGVAYTPKQRSILNVSAAGRLLQLRRTVAA